MRCFDMQLTVIKKNAFISFQSDVETRIANVLEPLSLFAPYPHEDHKEGKNYINVKIHVDASSYLKYWGFWQ